MGRLPMRKWQRHARAEIRNTIARYTWCGDFGDADGFVACFTEDAVVKDEGRTHHGRAGIRKWKADVSAKFQYATEPLACEQTDGRCVVTCKITGNFPGSPVVLRFFFGLEGDKIASLEIIP